MTTRYGMTERQNADVDAALKLATVAAKTWTDQQREAFTDELPWCKHCGSRHRPCYCMCDD